MSESSTYQAILAKGATLGAIQEAGKILSRLGRKHLGTPDGPTVAALDAIAELQRLEELSDRVHEAASWNELLGQPTTRPRNGRRRSNR